MTRRTRHTLVYLFFALLGVSLVFILLTYRNLEQCAQRGGDYLLGGVHNLLLLTSLLVTIGAVGIYVVFFWFIKVADREQEREEVSKKAVLDAAIRERNRAQLYLDIAGVMFAAIDRSGTIILINRKGGQILGWAEDELLGRNWFDVCLPPAVVGVVKEVFAKQMAGEIEAVEFFENAILTSSGAERVIAFHNTLLHDDDGVISGVLFSGEDITERKQAEASLEKAANEWRAAMDASMDAIYLLDPQRRLMRANREFYRMVGSTPEACAGRHISEILHPGFDGHCAQCVAEESLQDAVTVLEEGDPENYYRHPVQVTLRVVRDVAGAPLSLVVTRHDLTADRETQRTLRESEERYRQLVELSQDIIFIKVDDRIAFINDAGVRMLGAGSVDEILSREVLDFIHPASRELFLAELERASRHVGQLPVIELDFLRLDGETFCGEATTTSIMHHGKPAVHFFVRDITNRKNLEAQLRHSQKLEAVGHLAGGIAHDFNNILTVIGGYGALLEMRMTEGDPGREMLDQVLAASDRAANLTRSLLAFSRKQEMHPAHCDLNEIVLSVSKFLKRIIGEDIAFETDLASGALAIYADCGQIEQVIINLATNARDAMRKGGTLTVATRSVVLSQSFQESHGFGAPGDYALITVADTGSGMDDATRCKIFEPFFTTKDVGKGTGLGLSIVYGIVQQHKGFIDVESEAGVGTTFHIYLPVLQEQAPAKVRGAVREELPCGDETILVVEDEEHVRDLVNEALKQFGYSTILAVDGADALEKYREHRGSIALVFTDLIMPRMSGRELYDELKREDPAVRILFTSGYTADMLTDLETVVPHVEILMKPISPPDLARKVRELLDA
ncbi:PAS domain S-box protein [Geomonas edaphica]|uniref:PAS domain S-box protein n=1 Tax=Geomonas edaphica TaxID=2570226 RepID=UPI0010A93D25|nr:PAS domain S-box protein [Geomonas edaphica]